MNRGFGLESRLGRKESLNDHPMSYQDAIMDDQSDNQDINEWWRAKARNEDHQQQHVNEGQRQMFPSTYHTQSIDQQLY